MRGMKNVIVFVLFGLLGISRSIAQDATVTTDNGKATLDQVMKDDGGWLEDDENYTKSLTFRRQVGIAQVTTGSVFLPSGLAMIGFGAHKLNVADQQASDPENVHGEDVISRKAGILMITTGSLTSVAGALLIMKGCDTMKEVRNRKGDVVGEIGLSNSGIIGVAMKF